MHEEIERRSRAISLTVLELDLNRDILIPAYLLANLMSPSLWEWRAQRRVHAPDGTLLGINRRLKELERHFRRYTFTYLPNKPGGDPWGLFHFLEEEKRLGSDYIQRVRQEYDQTLRKLLADNPESQFGQIVNEDYYKEGYFPRLRNEIIEVMDAYSLISSDGRGSGKCAALAVLWAAALIIWGRFSPEKIVLVGNRAHIFTFLDEGEGHLFNNTKWFNQTRIHNCSELSEFVKMVTTSTDTTFFYNPSLGMCHCTQKWSGIDVYRLHSIYKRITNFLLRPLKHPEPESIRFVRSYCQTIPNPLEFSSAKEYQSAIYSLAQQLPGSIYDFAQYAFRKIDVPFPQAYIYAALRDHYTRQIAKKIKNLEDAFSILKNIAGKESIFRSRERIALPDETLTFKTGNDRDKALLLFTLLTHSPICDSEMMIGF